MTNVKKGSYVLVCIVFTVFFLSAGKWQDSAGAGAQSSVPAESGIPAESGGASRVVTDMAGRRVEIPREIRAVYSTGEPGVVALYTLCPEKLAGWCDKPMGRSVAYIEPAFMDLPELGLMQGNNNTANREEIIARGTDLILLMGDSDESAANTAATIQATMGIPVLIADYRLEKLPAAYRFLGEMLGVQARAEELAAYCEAALKTASENAARVPADKRVRFYYAQGGRGLQTAPAGSSHTEVVECAGGINVVNLTGNAEGRQSVNMEQILAWNPQVILLSNKTGDAGNPGVRNAPSLAEGQQMWNMVEAVKTGRVYSTPNMPYNWLDMPPSANRAIGLLWIGNLFYPEYVTLDIREEVRRYYALFYRKELSPGQLDALLENAVP
ncbi:MAG: ABC transporter substrate-binding protein [Spirochaetaceae bacterium]|nr:ABC transporter substrate-binding protein [Spirochaetaceae bacterium]